ncbi:MAG: FtsH protease activity modulator HflK [Chloroflexota bacterium]|nr:FtsH protease activity modulator HflK [Chloroflexota bacterium]
MKKISDILLFNQPRQDGENELDELLRPFRQLFGGMGRGNGGGTRVPRPGFGKFYLAIIALAAAFWVGSGVYIVNPGEVAIVRTFGSWNGDQIDEGLHWRIPWPVEQVDIVSITRVRSMEIGFRSFADSAGNPGTSAVANEARMITGDENLVDVQMVVQYQVRNAGNFLFNVKDPQGTPDGNTLRDATASALRQVVGQRPIDDVLTLGKEVVQVETQLLLQNLLDVYGAGIRIVNVQLQDVQPPEEVQGAFKDVISAREDKERYLNEGEAYQEDIVPRARGSAQRTIQNAEAFKVERIAEASGEAVRFLARLDKYELYPEETRSRLYIETMQEVMPELKVIIIDEEIGGNIQPFLPLQELVGGSGK